MKYKYIILIISSPGEYYDQMKRISNEIYSAYSTDIAQSLVHF